MSPIPTCVLASSAALNLVKVALTWPLTPRRRKSWAARSSENVLSELENGHTKVTIASICFVAASLISGDSSAIGSFVEASQGIVAVVAKEVRKDCRS